MSASGSNTKGGDDERRALVAKSAAGSTPLHIEADSGSPLQDVYVPDSNICSLAGMVVFALGLSSGTFSAVLCKVAYDTTATNLQGTSELFEKPICMVLLMFTGMVPAIFFWLFQQWQLEEKDRDKVESKTLIVLIIPCLCDLICTLLLLCAQVYITASMWQMLRGTVIVITALLKKFALGHNLRTHMWIGVTIISLAMMIVACVSLVSTSDDDSTTNNNNPNARIGVILVLVACLAQGVQYVFEEKVMAVDNAPPLVVIGMEGLWGMVLSILVIYPIAYITPGSDMGSYENPYNSFYMIYNSPVLMRIVIGFVFFVTCYNCSVIYVTKFLSAMWHAILDNFRPITIWGFDLYLYYVLVPGLSYGEQWMVPGSYIQLAGLAVLLFGTAVYNGSITECDNPKDYEDLSGQKDELPINMQLGLGTPRITSTPRRSGKSASPISSRYIDFHI